MAIPCRIRFWGDDVALDFLPWKARPSPHAGKSGPSLFNPSQRRKVRSASYQSGADVRPVSDEDQGHGLHSIVDDGILDADHFVYVTNLDACV